MKKEIHDFLLSVDEKDNWEFPKNGRWDLPFEEMQSIKPELESLVGKPLDIDKNVQDASFLTDLGILDDRYYDREKGVGSLSYLFAIRFSNFGRMFTIWGSEWPNNKDKYNLDSALSFLERKGFKYIPADELDEPYDGINSKKPYDFYQDNELTWWIRYFDYI